MKGEKNNMNKIFTKIAGLFLGLTLAVGVGVAASSKSSVKEAKAASTIDFTNIGSGLTDTSSSGQTTVNKYKFNYGECKKQGSAALLAKGSSGGTSFFSNSTAMPGNIVSVKVDINSGAAGKTTYHCAFSTTECKSRYITGSTAVNITGGNSHTYNCSVSNAKYFCVALGNNNNGQVLNIHVTYSSNPTSIEVTTNPTKTVYYQNDTLDTTGIVVTGTYSDASTGDVTSECTFSPTTLSTVGTQTITVTHTDSEKTCTFDVTVNASRTITSVELNGSLTKTTYYIGDDWDLSGLDLKVNWSTGDPSYVDLEDCTVTKNPTNADSTSTTSLTVSVSYEGFNDSESYNVTVLAGPIYSKTMSDWTWPGSASTVYANSLAGTTNQNWRLSSSEFFGSPTTYVLGDYNSSGNGAWSKFSGSNYYSGIASAITLTSYGFAMYTQDFTIDKLNKVVFSWTAVSGLSGTSTAYIVVSSDGGTSWTQLTSISQLGTNKEISWQGSTYSSTDNIIVALAFTSTTSNGQLRNISVDLYGEKIGDAPAWKVKAIEVNGDTNVEIGSSINLTTTINTGYEPAADTSVTWSSLDENYATVSSTGEVTGVAEGTVTIRATANDGSAVYGEKSITVIASTVHVESVSLDRTELSLSEYDEDQLVATVLPADATDKSVSWSTSDSDVIDVDSEGNLLAYSAGSATITVTTNDGGYTATCSVTVTSFVGDYEKVTDESQLYEGAKVILAAYSEGSYSVACGSYNSGKYYDIVSANFNSTGTTVSASGALEFTIHKYGNYYTFGYTVDSIEYYLDSADEKPTEKTVYSNDTAWTLSFNSGNYSMTGHSGKYQFQYNSSSPRFRTYNSSQKAISLYIETASKTATDTQIVDTFVNTELHMRDYKDSLGYCKDSENHYYSTAKSKYNSLSAAQKEIFDGASYADARERLHAWAVANGEIFDSSHSFIPSTNTILPGMENSGAVIAIVVVSILSVSAIGGYFFIRKRKELN